MPDRPEVSDLVRRISSAGDGTGPVRKKNIADTDWQRSRARRVASVFYVVKLSFGTLGLVIFAASITMARFQLLYLAIALIALPWARVGFRTLRGDN